MSDHKFLMIETGSEICSVALSSKGVVVDEIVVREPKSHAKVIGTIIDDILKRNGVKISECDAVVVNEGPGSYTGLRVGVSAAKGLCYGSGKPLIAVNSLLLIARTVVEKNLTPADNLKIYTVLDARRMEVYIRKFDSLCNPTSNTEAQVIEEHSFENEFEGNGILFAGNAVEKIKATINSPKAYFVHVEATASAMLVPATEAYEKGDFADTAYFEPFYLKDFVTGVSKKKLF